jgi:hypothetical protein
MEKELFIEYEEIKTKYKRAKNKYDNLLEKKAMLIIQTQPKAMDFSKEPTTGGKVTNKFDDFVQRLEKLDPELQLARNERDLQEYILKKKEIELKDSEDILDKVYYLKIVKNIKVRYICIELNYSRKQIYRYLEKMFQKMQDDTK